MSKAYEELEGLWVEVDRVEYVPEATMTPVHRPHQFAYYITIHNETERDVLILGRKWIVTNAKGHKLIVEGDGVVGQFPHIGPGEDFQYNSYHLVDSTSTAEGSYLGKDDQGRAVLTKIPKFEMRLD